MAPGWERCGGAGAIAAALPPRPRVTECVPQGPQNLCSAHSIPGGGKGEGVWGCLSIQLPLGRCQKCSWAGARPQEWGVLHPHCQSRAGALEGGGLGAQGPPHDATEALQGRVLSQPPLCTAARGPAALPMVPGGSLGRGERPQWGCDGLSHASMGMGGHPCPRPPGDEQGAEVLRALRSQCCPQSWLGGVARPPHDTAMCIDG